MSVVRRRPQKRVEPRAKTLAPRRLTRAELEAGDVLVVPEEERPRTRGECVDAARPCPWVACRYHLAVDINPQTGGLKLNFPHREIDDLDATCALDVAERGGATLDEVGSLLNLSRERVRQVEERVFFELRRQGLRWSPERRLLAELREEGSSK